MAAVEVPWAINELGVRSGWAGNVRYALIIYFDDKAGIFLATVGVSFPLFLDYHLVGNGNWSLLWGGDPLGKPEPGIPGGEYSLLKRVVGGNTWQYISVPGLKIYESKEQQYQVFQRPQVHYRLAGISIFYPNVRAALQIVHVRPGRSHLSRFCRTGCSVPFACLH